MTKKEFERALIPDKPGGGYSSFGPAVMMADADAPNGERWYANPYCNELEQIGSFKDYLLRQYGGEYLSCMKRLIEGCQVPELMDRAGAWGNPSFFANDLKIERIYFYYKSQTSIFVDVIFSGELTCHNGPLFLQQSPEWFRLRTVSTLEPEQIGFHTIHSVSVYDRLEPEPGMPLDDYLVPYTSTELLDSESRIILGQFYPEALQGTCPIDGRLLAARMGLKVQCFYLDTKKDIRGQLYYEPQQISILGSGHKKMKRTVKADTIVVNLAECLGDDGEPSDIRVNDTIIHECFHAYRHRLFYLGQRLYNKDFRCLSCNVAGQTEAIVIGSSAMQMQSFQPELAAEAADQMLFRSPIDWIEWQAYSVTPRIRMPLETFQPKAEEVLQKYGRLPETQRFSKVICELAAIYKVSKLSAKIRMIELGWEQAQGVLNFANGAYVEDYTVADEALPKNETYTLDFKVALDLYAKDKHFREVLATGHYQYVDGHFVLADEKYLNKSRTSVTLTDYAKFHMSECCLRFKLHRPKAAHIYREGVLHQECQEYRDVFAEYLSDKCDHSSLLAASQKLARVIKNLPPMAGSTLEVHMIQRHISINELTARSGVSPRTISRMRSSNGYRTTKESAIAICIGLRLEPPLSRDLLGKLGIRLTNSPEDILYDFILTNMYSNPISEANRILEANGMAPLCRATDELIS